MKIFVLVGVEERGPYTKSEIFALMKDGSVSADALGRWENETDWKPVNKILAGGNLGLFSVEEIAKKQEELPEAAPIVADFLPPRREIETAPPSRSRKVYAVAFVAAVLAIGSGLFMFHVSKNDSEDHPNLAAQPPQTPANAISPPPSTQRQVAQATTPPKVPVSSPTPNLSELRDTATNAQMGQQQNQNANAADNPPVLSESLPTPIPQNVEPPPAAVASEAPEHPPFQTTTRSFQLGIPPGNTAGQFWVSQPVESPRGVLVLCLEANRDAEAAVKAPVWLDYARNQGLALVAVAFTPQNGYPHAENGSAQLLFDGLGKAGFGRLPLLVYGLGKGGTFASSLANIAGSRINSWAVFTDTLYTIPSPDDKRPALIGCDYEVSRINPNILKAFEAGRDRDLKWAWLTVVGSPNDRISRFEDFVRRYFAAILAHGPRDAWWVKIDTLDASKFENISTSLKSIAWLPDESLLSAWKTMMPTPEQQKDPVLVTKKMATKVKAQPEIEMFLRLPPQHSKEHPIKGTLAFCTWEGDANVIRKELLYRTDMKMVAAGPAGVVARLIRYAEEHDMAVLTWTTKQVWSLQGSTDELNRKAEREFDQNFDRLANAWENGLKSLARDNNIPDSDLLLYGISRGAQWAHRLALRKPNRFLAVHVHIPSTFDAPTDKANKVLWLVTTGERESGYERASRFYQECRKLGYPIIFKAIMDLGHNDSPVAENLGFRFFDYALAMRDQRDELAASMSNPILREEARNSGPWNKDFHQPPFVGDFLNQDMFPLKEAQMIPIPLQVPLPTERIAQAWNK
jgi:hypothetical protein